MRARQRIEEQRARQERGRMQQPPEDNGNPREGADEVNPPPRRPAFKTYLQPNTEGHSSCIVIPREGGELFELKASMVHMLQTAVQFGGLPSEDPNAHITDFISMCDTLKPNREISDNVIRLKLFPFSLRDKAKQWLKT